MTATCVLDSAALRAWPLPQPDHDTDKDARGHVLVIAGSDEMPGAAVLAATAALRVGAGKLVVACVAGAAGAVAAALPEARVISLPADLAATGSGALPNALLDVLGVADAVLVGPGMQPEHAAVSLVHSLLPYLAETAVLVLDAAAMAVVCRPPGSPGDAAKGADDSDGKREPRCASAANATDTVDDPDHLDLDADDDPAGHPVAVKIPLPRQTVFTPHAGEMAHLLGVDKEAVLREPAATAALAARQWRAVVALKGASTHLSAPDGRRWCHSQGVPGLATSGSGDVLAGIVAGLAARGAPAEQAAAWGVALHAGAGKLLGERLGPLGFLARELAAELPALLAAWTEHADH